MRSIEDFLSFLLRYNDLALPQKSKVSFILFAGFR